MESLGSALVYKVWDGTLEYRVRVEDCVDEWFWHGCVKKGDGLCENSSEKKKRVPWRVV